ncbi:MAG: hypothetical protein FJ220_02730 [Kiritimatiellaceae bacterium]|nr:hypothetical protein [Kiritimatiellaceae bacterium]
MNLKKTARTLSLSMTGLAQVVLIGVGIATGIGFLGKLYWLFDLFSHFRVQYFQICLLLIAWFFWKRHYRWMAAGLGLALLNYAFVLPFYFGKPEAGGTAGKTIRVMQINLNAGNGAVEKVLSSIEKYNADLVLLEEVTPKWEKELQGVYSNYPHRLTQSRSDCFGIQLLSRFPFRSGEVLVIGPAGLPSVRADIETPQGPIAFIGTHPLPPIGGANSNERNQQLSALPELVKQQRYPVVLAGDLNLSPWSPWFRALLKESGLKNSMQGFGFQPSWPKKPAFFRIPLDHVLHSPDVQIVNRFMGEDTGSDHLPLIVDIQRARLP